MSILAQKTFLPSLFYQANEPEGSIFLKEISPMNFNTECAKLPILPFFSSAGWQILPCRKPRCKIRTHLSITYTLYTTKWNKMYRHMGKHTGIDSCRFILLFPPLNPVHKQKCTLLIENGLTIQTEQQRQE